ncbi:MAG TPA: DUF2911 domain-containing protein [Blastocatellia bacterium]|jgi:hypothetical protein|nr:DUF2911 domain-containing protein [Blastocatellia bacterium]
MKHTLPRIAIPALATVLCLGSVLLAQDAQKPKPKVGSFGSDSPERGTTRVGYWNLEKNMGIGQFAIDYGRPVWRKEYEDTAKFDEMTKGKVYRLGSNFWTTLDTDMPLKIAGKTVPIGSWYLGLHRSGDGATWSLAFIDPAKARAAHVDASEIERAPVEFKIPITTDPAGEMKEKLTIDLVRQKENLKNVTLRIGWGKIQLSAPIEVPVPTVK